LQVDIPSSDSESDPEALAYIVYVPQLKQKTFCAHFHDSVERTYFCERLKLLRPEIDVKDESAEALSKELRFPLIKIHRAGTKTKKLVTVLREQFLLRWFNSSRDYKDLPVNQIAALRHVPDSNGRLRADLVLKSGTVMNLIFPDVATWERFKAEIQNLLALYDPRLRRVWTFSAFLSAVISAVFTNPSRSDPRTAPALPGSPGGNASDVSPRGPTLKTSSNMRHFHDMILPAWAQQHAQIPPAFRKQLARVITSMLANGLISIPIRTEQTVSDDSGPSTPSASITLQQTHSASSGSGSWAMYNVSTASATTNSAVGVESGALVPKVSCRWKLLNAL